MGKKLKGLAKIELINAETGEVKTQYEHNIVTKAIPELYSKNPFGMCRVTRSPSQLMSGLLLFNEELDENINNIDIPRTPDAWAGSGVCQTTSTKRGNAVLQESKVTPTGCKFVWEFGTSQGNGMYRSLALTNPIICNHDIFGYAAKSDESDWMYCDVPLVCSPYPGCGAIGYEGGSASWDEYPDNIAKLMHNVDYIDVENGYFYKFEYSYSTPNVITITRATRKVYSIPIGQTNLQRADSVEDNAREGTFVTDPVKLNLTLNQALMSSNASNRITSIHNHEGKIYLFTAVNNTNSILQTTIDLNTFTPNGVEFTQKTLTYNDVAYYISRNTSGSNVGLGFGMNKIAFKYPYIYLPKYNETSTFYRLNIDDTTDITILNGQPSKMPGAPFSGQYTMQFGNFIIRPDWYIIDTKTNSISPGPKLNSLKYKLKDIKDDYSCITFDNRYYMYKDSGSFVESANTNDTTNLYYQCIAFNPFYLATINNVEAFEKTSADVMKITYTITETDG
jgi:hypothetical protein